LWERTSSCANFIVAVEAVKYPADRQPVSLSLRLLVREVVAHCEIDHPSNETLETAKTMALIGGRPKLEE